MIVKNVCCVYADLVGGTFSSVLAFKCPSIDVHVIDLNEEKIKQWNSDEIPLFEPDLEELVKKCRNRNLFFSADPSPIKNADLIFICPEINMKDEKRKIMLAAELKAAEDAISLIVNVSDCSKIIVEKSTVAVQVNNVIYKILKSHEEPYKSFTLISNPEFLTEGRAVAELLNSERVLIGSDETSRSANAVEVLISIYEHWIPRSKICTSDVWSAELSNLAENALLAQIITGINSISEICEATSADMTDVIEAINMDSRVAVKDLKTYIGVGGVNFYNNIKEIIHLCECLHLPEVASYWEKILDVNEYHKCRFAKLIVRTFFGTLTDRNIVILGFSFKSHTSCTRDSAATYISNVLLEKGAKLKICDPVVPAEVILKDLANTFCEFTFAETIPSRVKTCKDAYEAAKGADALILCTDWPQFLNLDYQKIFLSMEKPAYIFDGRRVLPVKTLQKIGFQVLAFGTIFVPT